MTGSSERWAYRAGVAVAVIASLLTVWTTVVRDDGSGTGYFMTIVAIAVGWFAAWFRSAGMARPMFGIAVMQVLLGIAAATAPSAVKLPGGWNKAVLFIGVFTALWLTSATLFRVAAKRDHEAGAPFRAS